MKDFRRQGRLCLTLMAELSSNAATTEREKSSISGTTGALNMFYSLAADWWSVVKFDP